MYSFENKLLVSKQREVFKNIYNKRLSKIEELSQKINYSDLKFVADITGQETGFSRISGFLKNVCSIERVEPWFFCEF